MKKTLLFISTFISLNIFAQVPSNVPTSGLVAYYSFSGNANDESGNGNNGTVTGATLTTDRNSNPNSAYNLSAIGSGISLFNDNSWLGSNDRTISFWINTAYISSETYIISERPTCLGGSEQFFEFKVKSGNQIEYVQGDGFSLLVNFTPNTWNNILFKKNGTDYNLYVNGVIQASHTGTHSTLPNVALGISSTSACIANFGLNDKRFIGDIDDVGIWNRALTQQEITAIYNNCPPVSSTINTTSPLTFCTGASAVLNANKTGTPYTHQWQLNATDISSATLTSYTATQTGSYTLITDSLGCKGTSAPVSIVVNTLPSVSINNIGAYTSYNAPAIILTGNPTGGTFSGAGVSVSTFTASTAGLGTKNITYSFTDANSCSNSASTQTIVYDTLGVVCTSYTTITTYVSVTDTLYIDVNLTGIAAPNNINKVKVYPNPANDHITIDLGNYASMSGYTVKIKNNLGQEVYSAPVTQQTEYIDLNGWSGNGMYFMHVIDASNNTLEIKKIVLQ